MSETVNNATIRVDVDASGVDAGLRRIEEGANRTGKNLDNLGATAKRTATSLEEVARTPGLEAAGDGAGVAAGRMDRATKSMAESIQRTLATMNAGAKGSAQYYEALANSRGLDVNALRPFLNQLDEMTKKSAVAAEAQRKLDESTKFLDSLRARTEGIGKSASELAALRAQQLGVSDAAAEMIEQLRQQEEAGESSFGSLSESAEGYKTTLLAVGAAVAAAAVAGAALVNVAINDLAELDDMAQKTGSSVESLSKIQKLATVFGADMAAVDGALTKLSKGMADLDEDSSKVQKALKALGVSSRDAAGGLRDPSVVLVDAATKLSGYNDSAAKTALINDLIGKSGADLLPFLNDLADNYDKVTGTSGEAAGAAAEFQDHIGWLTMDLKGLVTSVAVDVAPTLRDLVGTFSDVYKQQAKLEKGDWSKWADDLGLGFAKASDAVATFARSTKVAWDALKAVRVGFEIVNGLALISPVEAAYESFTGGDGLKDVKKSYADLRQAILDGQASIESLGKAPSDAFEAAYRARLAGRDAPADAAPGAPVPKRRELDYGTGSDKGVEKAAKAAQEYEALLDRINGKTVGIDPSFYADLGKLYAGYKAGKQSLAEYVATVEIYIGQQPFAKQAEQDRLHAAKELSDFQDGYAKSQAAYTAVLDKRLQDAETEATRNEELARTYGMTKSAIEQLEIARLEEQLAQRSTLGLTLTEIENIEKLIDVKKRNSAAIDAMEQVDAAKKAAEEWRRAADSIEQSLTDALLRGFESGKDFGENLVETLKNMFGTLVLRPVIQGVLAPVSGGIASLFPGAASGASASSAPSLNQTVTSLYNSFRTGGTFEKSVANGVQAGLDKLGLSQGSGAPGALAQGVGRATSFLGGVSAGVYGGRAISGGYSVLGGSGNTAVNLGTAIGMGMGPLGAAIGGIVGGVFNRAFGRGAKEVTGTTLNGMFGADGFAGTTDTAWKQDGGWFRSDKKGVDKVAVDAATSLQFTAGYEALKAASADFASVLGINADSIKSRAQAMSVALGQDEEANKKAIAEFFTGVGDTIARELLPSVAQFAKEGEGASATLERVAANYSMVETALSSINRVFGEVGVDSIAARNRLIELTGGLEEFAQKTAGFEQNFFTDAERNAIALKQVTTELASMGLAGLDTRAEFKELVLGLDLTTEAGAKQYASLMNLQEKFAQVYPLIDETAAAAARAADVLKERTGLQDEYDQLTMTSEQLLATQRAALDESNRALFDQIQAVKAKTAADEAAAAAIEKAKTDASTLMGGVDAAFSVLQRVVDRQKKALQEEISVRTASVQKIEALSQSLRSTLDGMTVSGREAEDRRAAQAQIEAALAIAKASGKLPSADDLRSALSVVSRDSSALFATQEDYLRDFYATRIGIEDLAGLTDNALSVEERSLKQLEDQVKQYDLMLEREQEQIDVLKGISITGLSIEQAIQALHGAMQAASANPINSATSAISDAYKSVLGRAPDQAGLDYWKDRAAGGISTGAIVDSIKASPEAQIQALYKDVFGRPADAAGLSYWMDRLKGGISLGAIRDTFESSDEAKKKLRGFAVGANYIPVDMPAIVHEGERIIPAADNRELMRRLARPEEGSSELPAAVARLTRAVEGMRAEMFEVMYQTAKNTGRSANSLEHIDRVGVEIKEEGTV